MSGGHIGFRVMAKHPETSEPEVENFEIRQAAALNEQKRKLRLELAKQLAELDERISKLTCLTNDVVEEEA